MSDRASSTSANRRYSSVAILLHWTIAALILYNLASGLAGALLAGWFFLFHISSGISILVLSLVRVVWRLTHRPPPFLPMRTWQKGLAHAVHFLLYAAMLAMPFSGWAMVSANPPAGSAGAAYADAQREKHAPPAVTNTNPADHTSPPPARPHRHEPPKIWGLFPLPMIGALSEIGRTPQGVAPQHEVHERIETFHLLGGWVMLLLVILHVAGALKHQFVDAEPELARMGIGRRAAIARS